MLVIRRLQYHPGPARWSMERIGNCNPGAVAFKLAALERELVRKAGSEPSKPNIEDAMTIHSSF